MINNSKREQHEDLRSSHERPHKGAVGIVQEIERGPRPRADINLRLSPFGTIQVYRTDVEQIPREAAVDIRDGITLERRERLPLPALQQL